MRARLNSSKQKRGHCEITDRDYKMFRFLWRWKVASSMALARKFFPGINPLSAYRRLLYLEADGYIKAQIFVGRGREVWSLSDKGFQFVRPRLNEMRQNGYKSEHIYHDYVATAFHLGEWLTHQPDDSSDYTEQQLRRYPVDAWPEWVPSSTSHRPDGLSIYVIGEKQTLIAFEVELSVKERDRYSSVVAYYDCETTIDHVLWLVDSKVTYNALKKSFTKFYIRNPGKHHFVLLSDFLEKGWMAPFFAGNLIGKCPLDLIRRTGVAQPSPWHPGPDTLALLDYRRRPMISKDCG